jgi:hypothetical protein
VLVSVSPCVGNWQSIPPNWLFGDLWFLPLLGVSSVLGLSYLVRTIAHGAGCVVLAGKGEGGEKAQGEAEGDG